MRVFQNLIGNAIKYSDEKPAEIHVSCHREAAEWVFSVKDNGIGIDPQYHDRIFEPFQRLRHRQGIRRNRRGPRNLQTDCSTPWRTNVGGIGRGEGFNLHFHNALARGLLTAACSSYWRAQTRHSRVFREI